MHSPRAVVQNRWIAICSFKTKQHPSSSSVVGMVGQLELEELWLGGPSGHLCALEQAKAWALREVWRADGKGNYGLCAFIAKRVLKNDGAHPTSHAVWQLFERIDNDKAWFPGKQCGETRGRKRVLTGAKASAVCRSAKAIKRSGGEVTYPTHLCNRSASCPQPEDGQASGQTLRL